MPQHYFLFHSKSWFTEYKKEYLPRWHRRQCAAESIEKLKHRLNVMQGAVTQQQKDIEQNKKAIENSTLFRLQIEELNKILQKHTINSARENKQTSKAREALIHKTKAEIERKKELIKRISAAQEFIPIQEENLKKLQQMATDHNNELVSKMAELECDKMYMPFFQSALSQHISSVLDKTFKIVASELYPPSGYKCRY